MPEPIPEDLLAAALRRLTGDPLTFIRRASGLRLRCYQAPVAEAVARSVLGGQGLSFAVVFPRQSGKNELQAQLEAYLLAVLRNQDAELVKVSPTWLPQAQTAMRRLERVLERNVLTAGQWQKENGHLYRLGRARITFLSGDPQAHIVGATASTLLEVDEAQDVRIDKFDKDIAPMAASTDATRVFWGTAWTSQTLLARELAAARSAEAADGRRRAFVLGAEAVAEEVPAYGKFVAAQVARLGRTHPLVRTQLFSEELDAAGGMFPPERVRRMLGTHAARGGPRPCSITALLLDVAGADEGAAPSADPDALTRALLNPRRDATALTVVEVDAAFGRQPVYRVLQRRQWVGVRHAELFEELSGLALRWRANSLVVDATGVGAGLASFLHKALPGRVLPFVFSAASKSRLGWDFLAVVDGGRWQEAAGAEGDPLAAQFLRQLAFCEYEAATGPERFLRWGVPDGTHDPASGELVHDDWIISAALSTVLDAQSWSRGGPAAIIPGSDPLEGMDMEDRGFSVPRRNRPGRQFGARTVSCSAVGAHSRAPSQFM